MDLAEIDLYIPDLQIDANLLSLSLFLQNGWEARNPDPAVVFLFVVIVSDFDYRKPYEQ